VRASRSCSRERRGASVDRAEAAPGPPLGSLADRREKVVACCLATATDFGADAAVLVVGSVPVTLLGTDETGSRTRFDYRTDEPEIRLGLACHDPARRVARVGAVKAEANAAHHLAHVVLGEISVCTTCTADNTVEALVDTAQERLAIKAARLCMQLDDLRKPQVGSSRSSGVAFRRFLP
jgi:hypothetical protein